ncbi:hypothetical protein [Phenylobacterium sp.]|uniref:hypothetical protein n=1 Tax=Phenylobacterium sp. TaxID=1871053 RepID=UPI003568E26F
MNPTIERLKLIFLGIFALANIGTLVWTVGWAMPEQKCLEAHRWWDGYERVCAQPILTSDITGRMITNKAARDAALRAIGRVPPPATAAPKP